MKQTIIQFELNPTIEQLEDDQLINVKGGKKHKGCPSDDDDD